MARLRDMVVGDLHLGRLHAGDRLPGVRGLAEELGVGVRAVARAYHVLEAEGLVEVRNRSGVYIAPQERLGGEVLEETAGWLAEMLVEAVKRRIAIPNLPEFVRRCTATIRPRVALLESTEDHLTVLSAELREEFGFDARAVHLGGLGEGRAVHALAEAMLPQALRTADLLVTTAFHAHEVRPLAEALGKPLVVLTVHPNVAATLERRLRTDGLTVVCADPAMGKRVRGVFGKYADRIRIVLASDAAAVAALRPEDPVLLTLAARQSLGETPLKNLLPHSPSISPESGRELAAMLIRLNVAAERDRSPSE